MIQKIDALITCYFPIVASAFFIYNDSAFAGHIFWVCWIPMVVNMTITMETYTFTFKRRSSLVSIFNLVLFTLLAFAGLISFEGFFLGFLMSENVAII